MNSPDDKDFTLEEGQLSAELGLARPKVRALRTDELVHGTDWKSIGGLVRYSRAGWEKLRRAVGLAAGEPAAPPPAPAKDLAPKPAVGATAGAGHPLPTEPLRHGDVRDLVVVRIYPTNKRILLARLGESEVRVRLGDNRKFTKGMTLPAKFLEADLWELARRAPRYKGKW